MGELDNAKLTPSPCCTYLLKQSDIPKVVGYALSFGLVSCNRVPISGLTPFKDEDQDASHLDVSPDDKRGLPSYLTFRND